MEHTDLVDVLRAAADILEAEGHSASVHPRYSGREMFGHEVPAISTSAPALLVGAAVYAAAIDKWHDESAAWSAIPRRTDSLGLDTVYYWHTDG